jgi:hypothetical protein
LHVVRTTETGCAREREIVTDTVKAMMTNLGYWRRLGAAVMAMLTGLPAMQSYAATTDAPASWVAYAQLVGQTFQTWIESDDADAGRFQQYLDARMAAAHADSSSVSTILIQTWIGPDGQVTDVRFDSLGNPDADAVLRKLLTAHSMSSSPPRDMRQPLRVRLSIQPNPEAAHPDAISGDAVSGRPDIATAGK